MAIDYSYKLKYCKICKLTYVKQKTVPANCVIEVYPNSIHLVIDRTMILLYNIKKEYLNRKKDVTGASANPHVFYFGCVGERSVYPAHCRSLGRGVHTIKLALQLVKAWMREETHCA